ncbi:Hypothetical protein FKW44_005934 [Caligus rogercresseyi]|uniref:Reverse transcriptase domain-containing protein n=1 Tax=Caligus rogercresseyi TaxID=217165 RepID=A0A7T8KCL5_CALRO|nr:Hypothetical protein FKW44_005934 [Caligus rogercresseyi]
MAFDLSSAFDTVELRPPTGKNQGPWRHKKSGRLFGSYLDGGKQCVNWNGTRATSST